MTDTNFARARALLQQFKGDSYVFGTDVLSCLGGVIVSKGKKAALICDTFEGSKKFVQIVKESLSKHQIDITVEINGAAPNCPREDLFRIAEELKSSGADIVISFGGGSTIDASKAAIVLVTLGGDIDEYFGTSLVSNALAKQGKTMMPHVAIQTAASSAAHLTKYSNITDMATGQKKLIVDDAIVPDQAVFDYEVTYAAPAELTADGALDGIAHSLEVLYGATGKPFFDKMTDVAGTSIALVVKYLPRVIENPGDEEARQALCLATDLGGYSIMIGGTNGGHLTSFSLVDVLSHGRACALMNPYYTVFFAPEIEDALRLVGGIYKDAGLTDADVDALQGRPLGMAVAQAMFGLAERIGFPTRLNQIKGFSDDHIKRALTAAKNPQLKMKLQNMPVPLTTDMIDEYMGPILEAAKDGDLSRIKNKT